jgi:hypothetical protein
VAGRLLSTTTPFCCRNAYAYLPREADLKPERKRADIVEGERKELELGSWLTVGIEEISDKVLRDVLS